jgi:hypothetical protein
MILNKCITEFHDTGPCGIDIEKAVKCWTKRCIISKWRDEYRIVRYSYKRHIALKVTISVEDAKELISRLNLHELPGALNSGSTFVMQGIELLRNL